MVLVLGDGGDEDEVVHFACEADDTKRAEEQAIDAYPSGSILWTASGEMDPAPGRAVEE